MDVLTREFVTEDYDLLLSEGYASLATSAKSMSLLHEVKNRREISVSYFTCDQVVASTTPGI